MIKAKFISHRVTEEGIYLSGITGSHCLTPDVELFVSRDEAVQFGWLDDDELDDIAEREAELQKLKVWNALSKL